MTLGDRIEIETRDGAFFTGILMFVHDDYIVLNGCGFAMASIVRWQRA